LSSLALMKPLRPLKILHTEAATDFGGQEQYILRLMRELRRQGHNVEALCQPQAILTKVLREEGFTVHTLPMDGFKGMVKGILFTRKLLKAGRFDIVNSHSRRDTLIGASAARLAKVPVIVRTRHLAKKVGSLLSYNILPNRVITPSEYVKQYLIQKGVAAEAIEVVYPSIDAEILDTAPKLNLRAALQLPPESVLVGCVAVLRTEKGHQELIEAMAPLCHRYPDLHLVIVGGGQPNYDQLQAAIHAQKLAEQMHMLGTRTDVPSLLPNFDFFALATHTEASGTAFVEAGAAGLAVVGTHVGGVPEMMQANKSGLLVPLFDIVALREAIETLYRQPELRQQMGQIGRTFCRSDERFTPYAMGQRTITAYSKWLKELQ